jgi:hypothetical protein
MYRRVVSLFLLPCVLMIQSAALGHWHDGREPAGHDFRPHFHTDRASSHEYGHHHHPPGGRHHRHDGEELPEPETPPTTQPKPMSEGEHDSDALFIDRVDVVLRERSAFGNELAASLFCAVAGSYLPTSLCTDPPREAVYWTHTPPPRGYACPLYLWQLALLI